MKYKEINIKQDMPIVADAMRYLQDSIARLKREKYDIVVIVHGYGSTGKGGAICQKSRQWLKAQESNKKLKRVIFGEDFDIFNFEAISLKNKCRELEPLLNACNNGITVVEL
jgi:hypothetical protein